MHSRPVPNDLPCCYLVPAIVGLPDNHHALFPVGVFTGRTAYIWRFGLHVPGLETGVIGPCLPREVLFYEAIGNTAIRPLDDLGGFITEDDDKEGSLAILLKVLYRILCTFYKPLVKPITRNTARVRHYLDLWHLLSPLNNLVKASYRGGKSRGGACGIACSPP